MIAKARRLRREKTVPERLLWRALRETSLKQCHFRQQVPIGPYIVDFAELTACLVIELDGDSHAEEKAKAYDAHRTMWLNSEGFRVLRFGNRDVLDNLEGVMFAIYEALGLETMCTTTSFSLPLVGRAGVGVLETTELSDNSAPTVTPRRSP